MTTEKPKKSRAPKAQFNVRQAPDTREKFTEAVARMRGVVQKAGGGDMSQSSLVEYWSVWFAGLEGDEQIKWARAYRDAYRARVDRLESEAASERGWHGGDLGGVVEGSRAVTEFDRKPDGKGKRPKRVRAPKRGA